MDTQLIITTNTQPISPVKKMVSTIRVAKTISEFAMLVTRAFPKPPKSHEIPLEAKGSIGEGGGEGLAIPEDGSPASAKPGPSPFEVWFLKKFGEFP